MSLGSSVDELVQNTVLDGAASPICAHTFFLSSRFSGTASITMSASASAAVRSVVPLSREVAASSCSGVAAMSRVYSRDSFSHLPGSAPTISSLMSYTVTVLPKYAAWNAICDPSTPDPITVTLVSSAMMFPHSCVSHARASRPPRARGPRAWPPSLTLLARRFRARGRRRRTAASTGTLTIARGPLRPVLARIPRHVLTGPSWWAPLPGPHPRSDHDPWSPSLRHRPRRPRSRRHAPPDPLAFPARALESSGRHPRPAQDKEHP